MGKWLRKNGVTTVLLIIILLLLVVRKFILAPYIVHGHSMLPLLNTDERILVNTWVYNVDKPRYGDVIVFRATEKEKYIKRVIGLPGDTVEIKEGKVYRNGRKIKEPYLVGRIIGAAPPVKVLPDHLYVLGDNRNNSKDSRQLGLISMREVVGRADWVLTPLDRFGELANN
ncbi:signal peptidase I Serine peptidase. MEROPS family S26A [Marininema mesophilum]|uniref:Signal peptidase I n=1 Tax=Marininema mesophilum TaxID=1048340 RepID=A0A1H2Y023_9BACL|nr:signal peptidase I [Marininema mesophilum]SDW98168.1 signal peptidase I Serine peptidase. MEROPS family S26A [Marininema mesophilum]